MDRLATLDLLKPSERGVIDALAGDPASLQRLLEMGLTEGEEIEFLRSAPLGDPLEIRIRGYDLSLRKSEARRITVRRTGG